MSANQDSRWDEQVSCVDGSSCGLWWTNVPAVNGERVGCLGAFRATSPASPVVEMSLDRLRAEGVKRVLGPMDGSTWHRYRFVTGGSAEPPFFLEPENPAFYPELFAASGFEVLARYSSSVLELGETRRLDRIEERLLRNGVVIRDLRLADFEADLDSLYDLSLAAFADNFLYTPINRSGFGELYEGMEKLVVPGLVRLAEVEGRAVAFVFAYPDHLERQRTGQVKTVVVKTLATHPSWRHLGIGSVLVEQVQAAARDLGFTRAIHALQHETNLSLKITRRSQGRRIRGYALYSRLLG